MNILDLCLADDSTRAIRNYFAHGEVFAVGVNLCNIDDMSVISQVFFIPKFDTPSSKTCPW